MPSQNRFTQSGYWCRWGGLSSVCTHMDGNCIALRLCAMERREGKGVSQEVCLNISKYFRGKPPSASIVYHTPTSLSRVYSVFLKNFFERVLSRFAAPPRPSFLHYFSPPSDTPSSSLRDFPLLPLVGLSSDTFLAPLPHLSTTTAISLGRPSLCACSHPFSQPQLEASLTPLFDSTPCLFSMKRIPLL